MKAGIDINVVYEKFVSIFAYLVCSLENDLNSNTAVRFPLLSPVSSILELTKISVWT
jgi:hypothetical protein